MNAPQSQAHPQVSPARIRVFDTTLRDGEQSPGCSMTPPQKLVMARALAELGADIIETGFPASSQSDREAMALIGRELREPTQRCCRAACAATWTPRCARWKRPRARACMCSCRPARCTASTSCA